MHAAPSGQDQQNAERKPEKPPRLEAAPWIRLGMGRATVYTLIAANQFPRPVKLGRASRWIPAEIDAWVTARVAERDATNGEV